MSLEEAIISLSHQDKLQIIEDYIVYKQNIPIIDGKPLSLNKCCQSIVEKPNYKTTLATVKRLVSG